MTVFRYKSPSKTHSKNGFDEGYALSLDQRLTDLVRSVVEELVKEGREPFRPGDVVGRLREQNQMRGASGDERRYICRV